MRQKLFFAVVAFNFFIGGNMFSQKVIDCSSLTWNIWLDEAAQWVDDSLFLPPINVAELPVNEPTIGWEKLYKQKDTQTNLPATVEEYFWGENGNSTGIAGNYTGVSWFFTSVEVPKEWRKKHVFLDFESVRVRAEVFVNNKLAGYDLINGTPFSVDVSSFVEPGEMNKIAVRITDPCGNFAWRDWDAFYWGDQLIPPSHGFGGITGGVVLRAEDDTHISDVFVKNGPDLKAIDLECTVTALKGKGEQGKLSYQILDSRKELVKQGTIRVGAFDKTKIITEHIEVEDALPWSVENPVLYYLNIDWESEGGDRDIENVRFGFRWFEVKEVGEDKMFFLNGQRIVLRSAISWGHWPVNGIYPTPELAEKQITTAKKLGLNMLNFHRGIGQTLVLNYADELGLLYYQEPGGYKPNETDLLQRWKREKLLRMVKRDRNHPSMVIYNMINESAREPFENELKDMAEAHRVDETRIITFTSTYFGPKFHQGECPKTPAPFKSHMLPYDHTIYDFGWWDEHHAGGPGVYADDFYNKPSDIYRHYGHPEEIVMLGEDGAIGTLPRLEFIKEELNKNDKRGWDGDAYLQMYDVYDEYIKNKGFEEGFPSVDALTKSIAKNAHYYQGRIIENFRIGNTGDAYVVNGWEDTKVENHSGIVDIYRNPKADDSIMAYYNQPLYVAVKLRNKVSAVNKSVLADFFIVNEENLHGDFNLKITVSDTLGVVSHNLIPVVVSGGVKYGELLMDEFVISPRHPGYSLVKAELLKGQQVIAKGRELLFALDEPVWKFENDFEVADTSGNVQKLLNLIDGIDYSEYSARKRRPVKSVLIVGEDIQPGFVKGNFRMDDPIIDWISEGNTMLVIDGADNWCNYFDDKEIIEYRGMEHIDRNWFGGNYFVREHPLFEGLPVNTAFNWEYQSLARYNRERFGLRLPDGESVVGVYADHRKEVFTAVAVIPVGMGRIIVSGLDLKGAISSGARSAIVARKILMNYLKYSLNGERVTFKQKLK
ncbi:glycoside hydrolase family 2 protein [Thermophagus sp. OGC60D27]|uniref:glycoside hydrolase family 2 protein n=1 Tax=Thermophagus sp. OGC60D27 TaxID=3458415 RepID=UPI0040376F8C